MAKLYDLARMTTATTGTGTITLGSAVSGRLSFSGAGVTDGQMVSYGIADGANSECGTGLYTASGTTLTRNVTVSTNSNSAISLSGGAQIYITARAEDIVNVNPPQGRLTLQTGTPVMTTTQSGKTTVYYTPYNGRFIPIYDGTEFTMMPFSELSVATTDTTKSPAAIGASKVNDWFVWNDSGTLRIGHGPDWTSDTARSAGTALTMVNGINLNNASLTNGPAASRGTYVGTTRSNASSQIDWTLGAAASGGTAAFLGVWNTYNRRGITTAVTDNGTSYTYTSATTRQARASAGNQISYVLGLQEDGVSVSMSSRIDTAAVLSAIASFGIGFNSTTTYLDGTRYLVVATTAGAYRDNATVMIHIVSPIGLSVISMNEASDGSNANNFNVDAIQTLSSIIWM